MVAPQTQRNLGFPISSPTTMFTSSFLFHHSLRTRTESYQEKVVTHRESKNFAFSSVSDASGKFVNLGFQNENVTRVSTLIYGQCF